MRRIFTQSIAIALFAVASVKANAQTCAVSTTAPGGVTYSAQIATNAAQGFTMTNPGAGGVGQFINGSPSSALTSPIYYYNAATSTIRFRINLISTASGANGNSVVTGYTISIISGLGGATVQTCTSATGFTVVNSNQSASGTNYFFSISGITMPASTNFRVRLTLNVSNADKEINSSLFATDAIQAPSNAVLPVRFSSLEAKPVGSTVALKWNVDAEENLRGYEVERSTDGVRFGSIGSVNAASLRSYSFVDNSPVAVAYYRIKSVDIDGKYGYSSIVSVKGNSSSVVIKAFMSNPTSLTVQHDAAIDGARINVSTVDGRLVRSISAAKGAQQSVIDLSAVQSGLLIVRYDNGNGVSETIKVIKP